ncbi:MAG: ABC transporter permease, partial [Halanaerobiaceae bacterium]|nr:ABC transporter permease [Halanaerobiaceae bacterium]
MSTERKKNKANNIKKDSRLKNMKDAFLEFWQEFKQVKYGITGLVLLMVFILLVILETYIIPFSEAGKRWNDISYWKDNPRSAAPVWINWFSSEKSAVHEFLTEPEMNVTETPQFKIIEGVFNYDYKYDLPPAEITFKARAKGDIVVEGEILRPDGETISLVQKNYHSRNEVEIRIPLASEAQSNVINFGRLHESEENRRSISTHQLRPLNILFARAEEGILTAPVALKGDYQMKFTIAVMGEGAYLEEPELIVSGRIFGFLGTDDSKRDLWSGIVAGSKWGIFIGLLTAFVSVTIGIIYGVTSAYYGGWIDSLMMRVAEIFASVPMLPVLVVLSALYKPSIWILIIMMCVFYWVSPVRTVRSMALQIKEETYIEAAHALDASNRRIIFKHMIPQLIPYAFASMALSVPGAIVSEATISLLGLGDATIVTWGQILHSAMKNSAILKG